jgi:hypothetical protein
MAATKPVNTKPLTIAERVCLMNCDRAFTSLPFYLSVTMTR